MELSSTFVLWRACPYPLLGKQGKLVMGQRGKQILGHLDKQFDFEPSEEGAGRGSAGIFPISPIGSFVAVYTSVKYSINLVH